MTEHRAVLIAPDGTVTAETYDAINLDTLTEAVHARYVDCIQMQALDNGGTTLDAWVDDEGLLNGSEPNPVASAMIAGLSRSPCQQLHGRVLIASCDTATGESIGLPDEYQGLLVAMGEFLAKSPAIA